MKNALDNFINKIQDLSSEDQNKSIENLFESFSILKTLGLDNKEAIIKSFNTPTNSKNKKFIAISRKEAIEKQSKSTKVFRKLYRYKDDIFELRAQNVSYAKIVDYLNRKHKMKRCSRQSVCNFVRKVELTL